MNGTKREWDHAWARDEVRDVERDEASGSGWDDEPFPERNELRDCERDEARDVERDEDRDAQRDKTRDTERDSARDARRDKARDAQHEGRERDASRSSAPLIVAMAEQCRDMMAAWGKPTIDQPASLQLEHLDWMCCKIQELAGDWPTTKLHRWIGFIQGGMIANRMLRLEDAKQMFDMVKQAHPTVDEDLIDHLNPDNPFELELGGEG